MRRDRAFRSGKRMAYRVAWKSGNCENVFAAKRRPGPGRQPEQASALCAVLVIALKNFAFRSDPIVGFVAWFKSAAFG